MEYQNLTEKDVKGALAAIKHSYDPIAAQNLIKYFYICLKEGRPYNEKILQEYLYYAFGKIIEENKSADHAFGFKRGRGKYERENTLKRDVETTAYIILLMRKDWTWEAAKGETADQYFPDGTGEKAIEAAYSLYKPVLEQMPDDYLMEMLPPDTPVITRNMTG